jgi:hypothetical protein
MMDLTWQLEALASILTCVALGLIARRGLALLDRKRDR